MKISRRIKASRANGAKSNGPKTPEGKLRSQTHTIRHGLLAKAVVVEGEDPALFKTLMAECEAQFAPVDEVELGMVEEMAVAYWRMRRSWTIEAELMSQGVRGQQSVPFAARMAAAFTDPDRMPKLALLQRYEARLHRMYQRALQSLILLREFKASQQITEQPNSESEHSVEPQPQPSEPVAEAAPKPPKPSPQLVAGPEPLATTPPAPPTFPKPKNQEENPAA